MNRQLEYLNIEFQHLMLKSGAGCIGLWDTFFPEDIADTVTKRIAIQTAKEICNACPIREQCLEFALANNEAYGIWGSLTPQERSAI